MRTIGVPPGAILFRLTLMMIIVAILVVVFLRYVDDTRLELERQSILQTKRIIDASLAVAFAGYAVEGRLDDLNELDGGNPFAILERFELLPPAYQGEHESAYTADLEPGWHYLKRRKLVVYRPRYTGGDRYYALRLDYEDLNRSGSFEAAHDRFTRLQFVRLDQP